MVWLNTRAGVFAHSLVNCRTQRGDQATNGPSTEHVRRPVHIEINSTDADKQRAYAGESLGGPTRQHVFPPQDVRCRTENRRRCCCVPTRKCVCQLVKARTTVRPLPSIDALDGGENRQGHGRRHHYGTRYGQSTFPPKPRCQSGRAWNDHRRRGDTRDDEESVSYCRSLVLEHPVPDRLVKRTSLSIEDILADLRTGRDCRG